MLIDANQLVGWVVSPLLAAIVGGLVVYVKGVVKRGNDHDLGGNGTGTKLYQEIMNAHVEEA